MRDLWEVPHTFPPSINSQEPYREPVEPSLGSQVYLRSNTHSPAHAGMGCDFHVAPGGKDGVVNFSRDGSSVPGSLYKYV